MLLFCVSEKKAHRFHDSRIFYFILFFSTLYTPSSVSAILLTSAFFLLYDSSKDFFLYFILYFSSPLMLFLFFQFFLYIHSRLSVYSLHFLSLCIVCLFDVEILVVRQSLNNIKYVWNAIRWFLIASLTLIRLNNYRVLIHVM
jgi:hypothetical protein